jgi:hypothetical protein
MTSTPETIPTPQTDPHQPTRWAFVRSLLSSLVEAIPCVIHGLVYFCLELIEIFLKTCFIFLFVNICGFFILFMGDYIFCNSAHAARFDTIANVVAPYMTVRGVLFFITLYGIASIFRKWRTDFDSVVTITARKTRAHTPD